MNSVSAYDTDIVDAYPNMQVCKTSTICYLTTITKIGVSENNRLKEDIESIMNEPLLKPITYRFTDRSSKKVYAFSYFCDQCGKEWRSTPQVFDPGGLYASTDLQIIRMLWNDQYKAAYEQANLEAIYALILCPECGRRVCMECFSRSEVEVADACKDCLSKREENQDVHKKNRYCPTRLMY